MVENLLRLSSDKYSVISAYAVKGRRNGDYQELIFKIDDIEICRKWYNPNDKSNNKKRSTGGKRAYVKLYIDKLKELKEQGASPDSLGCLVWLIDNIEWQTGKLYKGRGRNKRSIEFTDFMSIFKLKERQTRQKINELISNNLLKYEDGSYYIASDFMQKGGGKIENNNL